MEAYVKKNIKPYEDAEFMFAYADGIIGRAFHLKDFNELHEISNQLLEFIKQLKNGDYVIRKKFSEYVEKYKNKSEFIFFTLVSIYRDIAMCARFGKSARILNENYRQTLYEMSKSVDYNKSQDCIKIIDNTWRILGRNANFKIAIDTMLIKLQEDYND